MRVLTIIAVAVLAAVPAAAGGGQEPTDTVDIDEQIESDVEQALVRDTRVEAEELIVMVENGVVTLTGSVDSLREETAAIEIARGVLGVVDVVDEMDVVADAETTAEQLLELDVRQALTTNPNVDASRVVVEADATQVTLTGSVESLYQRTRAGEIAADVVGVVAVVNELSVQPAVTQTDAEIRRAVQGALIRNSLVDRDDITVFVENGRVTLSGEVSNWIEQQEALDAAQFTAGVTSVVDDLEIAEAAFDDIPTDTIREEVRQQLEWDVRVNASNVSLSVADGIVTLSGTVATSAARSAAVASAWSVAGVRDVVSRLEVAASEQTGAGEGLARIVENALQLDPDVAVTGLEVAEDDGVVELYGSVDQAWMVREAEAIARNTVGVTAVENNLVVVPPSERTDVEIRLDVLSSLQSDTRVDASNVQVVVDDGTVILDGTVASWDAWETAYAIALRTDGVIEVESELTVTQ